MIQNGKWFSNAECICVVCVEVLRHSQQLMSCRVSQLPINTVPRKALLLKDLISDFYLTSLQLVLCRVAAIKRLPVHQP